MDIVAARSSSAAASTRARLENIQKIVFGGLIIFFLIKEPQGLARLLPDDAPAGERDGSATLSCRAGCRGLARSGARALTATAHAHDCSRRRIRA